jgi:hypothetical protein
LRGSIDQFAHLRLDADIERFAPGGLAIGNGHGISLESGYQIVMTQSLPLLRRIR